MTVEQEILYRFDSKVLGSNTMLFSMQQASHLGWWPYMCSSFSRQRFYGQWHHKVRNNRHDNREYQCGMNELVAAYHGC
ncbi:hypothetical protein [Pseudoalteromonas luteoviolacea]|uniref:Uncharacterized protein n=1 Tax=Pseudoalteromonas luteoviolacea H33 TaxID=1365251 RepID=A0A166ZS73_9GAMM|nr:hypothetical protein [Pseudoalteromonas luteoviolacea]KZN44608.1 hypothetical protein N476_06305 [Pseudoalteromonas luteoviolacea H33]KZN75410.1 hypothetical protein N477_19315 [Pseudoalteromonas luteoviolacea H33-S]MBQ4877972.1 hypothetical protein [Pseudoalteromonas luteoviolacea]MBQ4907007.1 hypothetical protein [Pseudoalteromonas luteoviolacea]